MVCKLAKLLGLLSLTLTLGERSTVINSGRWLGNWNGSFALTRFHILKRFALAQVVEL